MLTFFLGFIFGVVYLAAGAFVMPWYAFVRGFGHRKRNPVVEWLEWVFWPFAICYVLFLALMGK